LVSFFHSTVSSAVNAMACVLVEDFIKPHSNWKDDTYKWLSKGKSNNTPMCSWLYLRKTGNLFLRQVFINCKTRQITSCSL